MKIIDLSQPLHDMMPVYPGDPEVVIKEIHTIPVQGWNLRNMTITTHIGTHVNVPYHMVSHGKTLDDCPIDRFMGEAVIFNKDMSFTPTQGVIFTKTNITDIIVQQLIKSPPKFVGLSADFDFEIEIEKLLLEHNIISFENLINTGKLPPRFTFYGVPLNIRGGDGSPVRAYAIVE